MKQLYIKHVTKLLFCFIFSLGVQKVIAQAPSPGTMEFGSSLTVLSNTTNPSVDASTNALLNNFDVSGVSSNARFIAFANSGNEGGTDAIGSPTDHVLTWTGNTSGTFSSGTMSSDTGEEFGITAMEFAYAISTGGSPTVIPFTFEGKKNGSTVGTIVLNTPPHDTEINIDFTSPTTGSFADIDEIVITPATPIAGGFSVDEMVIIAAVSNTNPTINIDNTTLAYTEGNAATQIDAASTVNDADGDADWNGGTLQAQITANNEATDEISISDTDGDGTAITVSGTNILANGTDIGDLSISGGIVTSGTILTITFDADATNANVQEVLQSLRYRSTSTTPGTSNRTITVTATDTNAGTANDTRTISISTVPSITSVSVPFNGTYITGQNLDFTINFDENVIVNTTGGTPQLAITIGSTVRQATFVGGSGSSSLAFRYTVQNGDLDTDGIAVGSLATNGGTMQNGAGTNANLTLNSIGNTTNVLVDAVVPTNPVVTTPVTAVTVNASTQTISGTHTENGVTVHAYADNDNNGTADNTTSLGSATVTGNAWSFSVNLTQNIDNNFVVQASDGAGNTSSDVDVPTITDNAVVTWTGATDINWHTGSNWSTNTEPVIGDDVIIPSGLINYPTVGLTANSNTITVESGAVIVQSGVINGTITFKRNLATTNWYLISSPLVETIEDFRTNNTFASGSVAGRIGLAPYDNTQAGTKWTYQTTSSTGNMNIGQGYSVKLASAGDLIFTGNAHNTTPVNRAITIGAGDAFNLIGNPYLSYYDSNAFLTNNTSLLTSQTIWIWNQATNSYDTKVAADNFKLAPAQGFFVECGTAGNVEFYLNDQSHSATDTFQKTVSRPEIHLNLSSNNEFSKTKFYFIEGTTKGFDNGYDGKMFTGVSNNFSIYSHLLSENKGINYAVQSLPKKDIDGYIIPIGLNAKADKKIVFSINSKNLPSNLYVYLEDKTTQTYINLSKENYTITTTDDISNTGRFYIHTSSKKLGTQLPIATSINEVKLYKPEGSSNIIVTGLQEKNIKLKMFSLSGKQVFNRTFSSDGYSEIKAPKLSSGVYLVELVSDLGKTNTKIILD